MSGEAASPEFESFLMRIWHEPASRAWRGKLIHISSRESCDFVNLEQALAFVLRYAPILTAGPRPADEARLD